MGNAEYMGEALGRAIKDSNIKREEFFITSKIPGGLTDSKAAAAAVEECLNQLGMNYVDLMLIHYPATWSGDHGPDSRVTTWKALEAAVARGSTRAIGVSHFCPRHVSEILAVTKTPISVNQVEYHIGMANSDVNKTDGRQFDVAHNITYQSFMPLCGQCNDNALITGNLTKSIGQAHGGRSGAQVALRWLIQQGIPAVPRSGNA